MPWNEWTESPARHNDMTTTVYNSSKQRLEMLKVALNNDNTTWFDDNTDATDVHTITDADGGLLIAQLSYNYPL